MSFVGSLLRPAGAGTQTQPGAGPGAPAQPAPGGQAASGAGSVLDVLIPLYKGASTLFGLRGDRQRAEQGALDLLGSADSRTIGSGQGCTLFETRGDPADVLRAGQAKNVTFCLPPQPNVCMGAAPSEGLLDGAAEAVPRLPSLTLRWPEPGGASEGR
jgi:hypothetical protein